MAYRMSQIEMEAPDFFLPALPSLWGEGKWPSYQTAWFAYLGLTFYGSSSPMGFKYPSLYSAVFHYDEFTQNNGLYTGPDPARPDPKLVAPPYFSEVSSKKKRAFYFTF